jgi:purine nucleoside permease
VKCDATSGDTVWGGSLLATRAQAWTTLLTSGDGTYCTAQQTDNATFAALSRGSSAGLLDASRIAVVHAGAMFDRPYPGESPVDALTSVDPSIPTLAMANLAAAGELLTDDIVTSWASWQSGVPQ